MAIEEVAERLRRSTAALEADSVLYAVTGGNAVAEWVGRVDKAAVRFTQDVDILLRRNDLPLAVAALEKGGFVFRHAAGIDFFTDGPGGGFRDAVPFCLPEKKSAKNTLRPRPTLKNRKGPIAFESSR